MFAFKARQTVFCGAVSAAAFFVPSSVIHNESKRAFYQDLEDDLTVTNGAASNNKSLLDEQLYTPAKHDNLEVTYTDGMTIASSKFLEQKLNVLRNWTIGHLDYYFYEYETAKSSMNNELDALKTKYHSIVAEPVLPNLIYILTGALSGSVMVNKKALPIRFITPLIFGSACYGYFMPKSFDNTRANVWNYEKENFPHFAKGHIEFLIKMEKNKKCMEKKLEKTNQCLIKKVHCTRTAVKKFLDF
ncbi:hypothetical protein DASC09_023130 [Saccharomycopsis crataegensis]|uniref:MICOS complex subunit n=1 Tax=Saccharomycopsis crataegensis TaxID=43959 RepID=A0AAV5QJM8_9ASCO|nr:hypothetical protein DASC09_023130 [Saccharomycopsis crataegensis]